MRLLDTMEGVAKVEQGAGTENERKAKSTGPNCFEGRLPRFEPREAEEPRSFNQSTASTTTLKTSQHASQVEDEDEESQSPCSIISAVREEDAKKKESSTACDMWTSRTPDPLRKPTPRKPTVLSRTPLRKPTPRKPTVLSRTAYSILFNDLNESGYEMKANSTYTALEEAPADEACRTALPFVPITPSFAPFPSFDKNLDSSTPVSPISPAGRAALQRARSSKEELEASFINTHIVRRLELDGLEVPQFMPLAIKQNGDLALQTERLATTETEVSAAEQTSRGVKTEVHAQNSDEMNTPSEARRRAFELFLARSAEEEESGLEELTHADHDADAANEETHTKKLEISEVFYEVTRAPVARSAGRPLLMLIMLICMVSFSYERYVHDTHRGKKTSKTRTTFKRVSLLAENVVQRRALLDFLNSTLRMDFMRP